MSHHHASGSPKPFLVRSTVLK